MDSVGNTIYAAAKTEQRQANRMIILAGSDFWDYDLKVMGKERIIFGRDPAQCDIVIPVPTVSGVHGKIKFADGKTYVGDMGSTNGTYMYRGQQFERMKPRQYYRKNSGEWILRIDSSDQSSPDSVLIVLTNVGSKAAWQRAALSDGITTIGRDPRNTIVMEAPSFSRQHAAIICQGMDFAVVDYNSMNGVYVNGHRIQGQARIFDKDMIQIAGSLFFLVGRNLMYQGTMSGVTLTMENVSKIVGKGRERKRILSQVCCDIGSNEFVAIIGGSGAGKTTVMNAMSCFDSKFSGEVRCNGIDLKKNFSAMKNMIGFVPQQDIIYENLKLREMLLYTAKMKMPSDTSRAEMEKRIAKVLDMVDLSDRATTYIRKLSGGQKKRASIAVEMLADPGLFFLDEPTSGLDPDTEQSLMHTLATLSKSAGKTIVMVTHTIQSIDLCDKVIFMGPGGKICYCGPPSEICNYFGKKNLVEVYNELTGNVDNWNGYYLQNYWAAKGNGGAGQQPGQEKMIRATRQVSVGKQMRVLTARYMKLVLNDRFRLMLLFLQPVLIGLLLKVVAQEETFVQNSGTKSILFALSCSGIWIGLFNTIQEVCKERSILKREYMGNLKLPCYILSKYIVQGMIGLIQATILTTIFIQTMDKSIKEGMIFEGKPGIEVWLTMVFTIWASASIGLIISSLVRNGDRAMAVAPFVLIIQLLFSGVLFELGDGAILISKLTVSRWSMECLGNTVNLNDLPMKTVDMGNGQMITPPTEAEDFFVRTAEHLRHTWEILLFVCILCGVVSVILLRRLKKDTR